MLFYRKKGQLQRQQQLQHQLLRQQQLQHQLLHPQLQNQLPDPQLLHPHQQLQKHRGEVNLKLIKYIQKILFFNLAPTTTTPTTSKI